VESSLEQRKVVLSLTKDGVESDADGVKPAVASTRLSLGVTAQQNGGSHAIDL
jgi:hypothetical protein